MIKKLFSMSSAGLLSTVLTFLTTLVLTHIMTVDNYGVMSRWLTDISYLGFLFNLGLNNSMIYYTRHNIQIQKSMGVNIVVYIAIVILWVIISLFIPITNKVYYYTLIGTIFLFSINELARAHFQYEEKFGVFNFFLVFRPFIITLLFSLCFFLKYDVNDKEATLIYFSCMLVSSIVYFSIYFAKGNKIGFEKNLFKSWGYFTYGGKSILNMWLSQTLYAISIYMISWLGTKELVAYFFVANSISKIAWVIPDSAGNILYPIFVKSQDEKSKEYAFKEMYRYARFVFFINIAIFIAFVFLGKFVLNLLYSKEYSVAFLPTLILLIGNQGMVYYKMLSRWNSANNTWKYVYIGLIAGVLSNVILNLILTPNYGNIGTAIATAISFWVCGIVLCIPYKNSFWEFINITKIFSDLNLNKRN